MRDQHTRVEVSHLQLSISTPSATAVKTAVPGASGGGSEPDCGLRHFHGRGWEKMAEGLRDASKYKLLRGSHGLLPKHNMPEAKEL